MAPKACFGGFLVTIEVLMLEIDDLWVNIDDKEVLKGINLRIPFGARPRSGSRPRFIWVPFPACPAPMQPGRTRSSIPLSAQ